MREKLMKANYVKGFKAVVILAVLLALISAVVIPLSLSQQISDLSLLKQTAQEQAVRQDDTLGEHHIDREELWKSRITPPTAGTLAALGGIAVLWLALGLSYWLLVIAWLYKSAVNEGMNKSLWPILGLFTNLLIPLVSPDITDGVFRFAADRQSGRADVFSVGLRTIVLGSAGMLLAIALLQRIPEIRAYGFLLASFVIASCCHALCAHFVRAKGNTALFAAQGLFNTALFIGFNVLFLAVFQWGIRGYVLSTTAANLVTTALLILKERLWRYARPAPARTLRRQMLRYCIPLIPAAIFWWIMGVSDRYMVKFFLGSEANGIYAVAYKIPTILTILTTVFMDAWQLSAISEASGSRMAHLRFYGRIWDAFASMVFLGAGGIIALSPLLIRILADETYCNIFPC